MSPDLDDQRFCLTVTRIDQFAVGVRGIELAAEGELPAWEPGAHITLELPNGLSRQYSLCGPAADRDHWSIGVLREGQSRGGSAYLHAALAVGDELVCRGPDNHFPLVQAERYAFIAGGIGITPLVPMIREVERAGAAWSLLYGGRSLPAMAFREELAQYGDRVLFRPFDQYGHPDVSSYLGSLPADVEVYCCGPDPLIGAVKALMAGRLQRFHSERFRPQADPPPVPGQAEKRFELVLASSNVSTAVQPGESVLEAVRRLGVEVLSSCGEGTCGTCETTVLEGVPDHRDSLLTDRERADGDCMLICVSRSFSDRLVLDL